MMRGPRAVSPSLVLGFALAALTGCGGGSDTPTTPATPTPAPCTQSSLFGPAGGSVPARTIVLVPLTTSAAGRVDVVLDWTFPTSPMGVYLVQGGCSVDQFNIRTCSFLIQSEPNGVKPRRVSASNVAPGAYTLLIANFATVDESASTQVFLSSATCPPLAASAPSPASFDAAVWRVFGFVSHPR